jgi:ABC-type sugar transport system ATPase subunit
MMTDNKRVTNKQLQEELKKLTKEFETMNITIKLDEEDLNTLSVKIVSRMMNIQTMSEWYEHVSSSDIAIEVMDKKLNLTEEENSVGDLAKYMTLMELFKDKEEYEKCAICKLKLDNINKILKKY